GRVLAVMDGERRIEADVRGILAQQARADAVERARPVQPDQSAANPNRVGDDALDPAAHPDRRAAREGHQQYALRVGAVDDQVSDAVGEGVGLARAGARDDQEWPADAGRRNAMLDGAALVRIE